MPTIGIDITSEDIDEVGLGWIITRMLTVSGLAKQNKLFPTHCSRVSAISIHKSWLALDLPVGGIQGLHLHLHTGLMTGSAVILSTMKVIWETFPHDSPIVRAMGANFIRSHIDGEYTAAQSSMIQAWYQESVERNEFFKSIQHQAPKLDEVQPLIDRAAVPVDKGRAARIKAVLERVGTRRMSTEERKEREMRDTAGMRSRLRRVRSDESVRSVDTVVWDPPAQSEKVSKRRRNIQMFSRIPLPKQAYLTISGCSSQKVSNSREGERGGGSVRRTSGCRVSVCLYKYNHLLQLEALPPFSVEFIDLCLLHKYLHRALE